MMEYTVADPARIADVSRCPPFWASKSRSFGGMAGIADAVLAAAVSNAGGLGIISAMNADEHYVSGQIDKIRTLTNRPFGVNVMLMSPHADAVARIVAEKKVPVVTTGAGNASKYIPLWKEAGVKVIPVDGVGRHGEAGVLRQVRTPVIAEGQESGGHIGELTTMTLVPRCATRSAFPCSPRAASPTDAAWRLPLCSAPRAYRWEPLILVASECGVHPHYKQMILRAGDVSTVVTGRRFQASAAAASKTPSHANFSGWNTVPTRRPRSWRNWAWERCARQPLTATPKKAASSRGRSPAWSARKDPPVRSPTRSTVHF